MNGLRVRNLRIAFGPSKPVVRGIDLDLQPGEALGIVGETGCGKSVTALALLGLVSAHIEADVLQLGEIDLRALRESQWQSIRGRRIGMVFQDPSTSLNPVFTIGQQIEAVLAHHRSPGRAEEWLERVGLPHLPRSRYPHQLSGGQRQRVSIALALAGGPSILLADEPTTALDVTIQRQILDLLKSLQQSQGLGLLLISHDLGVVADVCQRVAVIYAGRIVEAATVDEFFKRPRHPYSVGLFRARPGAARDRLASIPGSVPSPGELPAGCAFRARCSRAIERCAIEVPPLEDGVACFNP